MPATVEIRSQADMERMYAEIREAFGSMTWEPFLQDEMRLLEKAHDGYWLRQASPNGSAWAPNAASTIRRKKHSVILVGIRPKGPGEPKLRDAMTLPHADGAIRITVDEWPHAQINFGNDVPYSPIHNEGLGKMAKREHVGLTLPHFEGMVPRAVDYAFEKLK
ncbi:MAG: hypothetical protein H0T51_15090 [Pirellulales bacterium]|nr:hypothetical protein [Pirellulales bacterium]